MNGAQKTTSGTQATAASPPAWSSVKLARRSAKSSKAVATRPAKAKPSASA